MIKIEPQSRKPFFYHFSALFFEGIMNGVWLLNDVVARKHFKAPPFLITLLIMAPSTALLFSLPLPKILRIITKSELFKYVSYLRLLLFCIPFCNSSLHFVLITAIVSISYTIFYTLQNILLKENYEEGERGKLFGILYSFLGLISILTSLTAGRLYDLFKEYVVFIYPLAGLSGFISFQILSKIRDKADDTNKETKVRLKEILLKKKDFLVFEISFFLYGTGFMMMLPLLPIFLVDRLKVNYTEASFLNGFFFQGMSVLFSWFIGRIADNYNPLKLTKTGFFLLTFYPLMLSISKNVYNAYFVYAFYGFSMAIVNITWYLSPLSFCRDGSDPKDIMAIHVFLAGLRSLVAFPLGTTLYVVSGDFFIPFLVASILFLMSSLLVPVKRNVDMLK